MKDMMKLDRKEKNKIQLYLSYLVLLNVIGEDTTKALKFLRRRYNTMVS
jgi:hypothetical protein